MSTMTPKRARVILSAIPDTTVSTTSIRGELQYINTDIGEQEDGRQRVQLDGFFTADELEALAAWMRDPDAVGSAC